MTDWSTVRVAEYARRDLSPPMRLAHSVLVLRGVLDAAIVLFRDFDVFWLQVALWRGGGLKGLYQFRRLRELSRLLRRSRPSVIEFGSGASTLLIAKLASRATSLEESQEWSSKLVSTLSSAWWIRPQLRAAASSQILVVPRREWRDTSGAYICGYEMDDHIISGAWDVAYVDGPTNWPQSAASRNIGAESLPNADSLSLQPLPKEIWVDGRIRTLEYLSELLPDDWFVLTGMQMPRASRRHFHTRFRAKLPS